MEPLGEIPADKAACAHRLVAGYGDRLYETAIRLCGNATDAEDYVFRMLERAIDRIEKFKGRSSIFTWLYEIMVNLMRTDARRKAANALTFPGELPEREDTRPNAGARCLRPRLKPQPSVPPSVNFRRRFAPPLCSATTRI